MTENKSMGKIIDAADIITDKTADITTAGKTADIITDKTADNTKFADKIMIVDDDPYMRSALSLGLSKLNIKGEIFSSAEDALEYIKKNITGKGKNSNDFFLIISDLNLSGMDGVSFLNNLKIIKEFDNIPFVIITAYGTIESAISAIRNGAADYLLKPFGITDLENIIKNSKERVIYNIHNINNTYNTQDINSQAANTQDVNFQDVKNYKNTHDLNRDDFNNQNIEDISDIKIKDIKVHPYADNSNFNPVWSNDDNNSALTYTNVLDVSGNSQLKESKNDFIFLSEKMKEIESFMNLIAPTDATVLITGESGTGKEVAAKYIHNKSGRKGDFIAVNCSAIVSTLLESELFGHEKGAFTGASSRKIGKFELADGGTILLDEIGDMDKNLQAKILRTLQENYIDRVGGDTPVKINSRVIAATNKDLKKMVEEGTFREDLYYRLNVLPIELPPLRERKIDIKPLSIFFIRKYTKKYFRKISKISEEALTYLMSLDYKGNVRELENIIERGVILAQNSDMLDLSHLGVLDSIVKINNNPYRHNNNNMFIYDSDNNGGINKNISNDSSNGSNISYKNISDNSNNSSNISNGGNVDKNNAYTVCDKINNSGDSSAIAVNNNTGSATSNNSNSNDNNSHNSNDNIANYYKAQDDILTIREMEKKLIREALKKTGGNKNKASELLGITSRTLRNKLKEFEAETEP